MSKAGRIRITHYSSDKYKAAMPHCELFQRIILVAWGTIDDNEYTYATIGESGKGRSGVVPQWFIKEANDAFCRAVDRKDIENE